MTEEQPFPPEISRALNALGNPENRRVFAKIYDEQPVEVSEVVSKQDEVWRNDEEVNVLIDGALVTKKLGENGLEDAYLEVTEYGERVLTALFGTLGDVSSEDWVKGVQRVKQEVSE